MPRILHIIESLGRTGTAQQLLLLANDLVREGWDVHVATLRPPGGNTQPTGPAHRPHRPPAAPAISFSYVGRRFPLDPLADLRLVRLVARLQPDVVHTWDSVPGMFGPLAAPYWPALFRLRRPSQRMQPHQPRLIVGRYDAARRQPAWEAWFDKWFARRAARIVTNNPQLHAYNLDRGIPAEQCVCIPPGVPTAPASDVARDDLLRELRLPLNARLIGVVGRLTPEKRVRDLIWAADLLRVLHDNLRMLIIGDGPLRTVLEQYARLASDLDHIRFLGERDDVWRIMPHLDVLWNGSEGGRMSIALLEAMAAGVPVVASDVPANRALVVHGETGYLVPLGSRAGRADRARHTDRIFAETALAARLANAALGRAKSQFGDQRFVQEYQKSYLASELSRSWP